MKIHFCSRPLGAGLFLALAAALSAQPSPPDPSRAGPRPDDGSYDRAEGDRTQALSSNRIEAGEKIQGDVRALMGSNTVEGSVSHDVVAVMGGDTIDGTVGHDVIATMGSVVINGTVGHNVKAVMGDVTLGPNSVVRGDVTSVGGTVHRAPGAIVRGRIISQPFKPHGNNWGPNITWNHDRGRSDWMEGVHNFLSAWRWIFTLVFLGFYALLALVFPGPVRRCGDVLAQQPLMTVLIAFASLLAVPLVFLLLFVTVIGIPVAVLLLPCAILVFAMFGKAGLYELIGRRLAGGRLHPAGAVLLGGVLCSVFYFVPFLGFLIAVFLSLLGLGCAISALLASSRGLPAPASALGAAPLAPTPAGPVPFAVPAPTPEQSFAAPPPATTVPDPSPGAPVPVPAPAPIFLPALPRAGFWIRMGALFIDSVIVTAACGSLLAPHPVINAPGVHFTGFNWMLPLAIYGAMMWKFKGSTIGGMICGLRVARLDGKPIEWETAIVRALACFLSAFLWLGFIWIAFDAEKQSWHDKIAGTVVVRTKGISLI